MISTWTFRQLLGLPTEDWTEEKLNYVSGNELTDLCCLVSIPYLGTKPEKISRLLKQTQIQRRLRGYGLRQGEQPSTRWRQASLVGDSVACAGVKSVTAALKKQLETLQQAS